MRQFNLLYGVLLMLSLPLFPSNAMPTPPNSSSALSIRPTADLELLNKRTDAATDYRSKRGQPTANLFSAPGLMLTGITAGVCLRIDAPAWCLGFASLLTAIALGDIAKKEVYFWTYERKNWAKENEKQDKEIALLKENVKEAENKAVFQLQNMMLDQDEKRFTAWKNKRIMESHDWKTYWVQRYTFAKHIAEGFDDEFKDLCDQATKNMTTCMELSDKITSKELELDKNHWEKWVKDEEGEATLRNWRDSQISTKTAILAVEEGIKGFKKKSDKEYQDLKDKVQDQTPLPHKVPGSFPEDDDTNDNNHHNSRRAAWEDHAPRLIAQFDEDCENKFCHRMWYSRLVTRGRKRDASSPEIIHNIYSTPLDVDFHNGLLRRGDDDDDGDDDGEMDECNIREEVIEGDDKNKSMYFRLASRYGGDWRSLVKIATSSTTKDELKDQMEQGPAKDMLAKRAPCVNLDTSDGGKFALESIPMLSGDDRIYGMDLTTQFASCAKVKNS